MMTDPRLRWPGTGLGTWGSSGFAMLAMALACTVSLAVVAAVPMPVKVCGEWREAFQGATVASVVGREPPAGDLVDVNGEVLELGGGKPGEYLLNGVSCLPDTPVRPGDEGRRTPGRHHRQAVRRGSDGGGAADVGEACAVRAPGKGQEGGSDV
jgi:hypothetical protein